MNKLLFAPIVLLLSGCASTFNVGQSGYGCSGLPEEGVRCMSAREVYAATDSSDRVTKADAAKDAAPAAPAPAAPPSSTAADLTPATPRIIPIRTPAKVMRAWIAPWEDEHGVLHASEFLFAEIEGRRWAVGQEAMPERSAAPLSARGAFGNRTVSPLAAEPQEKRR